MQCGKTRAAKQMLSLWIFDLLVAEVRFGPIRRNIPLNSHCALAAYGQRKTAADTGEPMVLLAGERCRATLCAAGWEISTARDAAGVEELPRLVFSVTIETKAQSGHFSTTERFRSRPGFLSRFVQADRVAVRTDWVIVRGSSTGPRALGGNLPETGSTDSEGGTALRFVSLNQFVQLRRSAIWAFSRKRIAFV
jgi:hypothetical protein